MDMKLGQVDPEVTIDLSSTLDFIDVQNIKTPQQQKTITNKQWSYRLLLCQKDYELSRPWREQEIGPADQETAEEEKPVSHIMSYAN